MNKIWVVSDRIVSPLGTSSEENYARIRNHHSGIRQVTSQLFGGLGFCGSVMEDVEPSPDASRLEQLAIRAAKTLLQNTSPDPDRTLLIFSTTKGNVEYLSSDLKHPRLSLHQTAQYIGGALGFQHQIVVSNACISGVLACIVAQRFLATKEYDHALIIGAEVLSGFIVSGFQSLLALSSTPCKPFDVNRAGINLGEAAGAMLVTSKPEMFSNGTLIAITGSGLSNDANHISGPSRTGKELAGAIGHALASAMIHPEDIGAISAHGTATLYNDEMEAKAFVHAGLQNVPLYSLKGYYGHTLGAAGVIETIIAKHALLNDEVIGTLGFDSPGVSSPVNVNATLTNKSHKRVLKTASGFGGCNAALILEKTI